MKRLLAILFVLSCFTATSPASAQNIKTQICGSFDTTVTSTTAFALLGVCNVTAGPKGIIFVIASGECTCGAAGENLQLWVGSGSSPVNGANFLGSVSGSTLTVTSMIPGMGPGNIATLGTITPGTGGTTGVYTVSLTSNSAFGSAAVGQITVSGGGVTGVSIINGGSTYLVGDVMSASSGSIGGVTGFSVPVATTQSFPPFLIQSGQTFSGGTGVGFAPVAITGQLTGNPTGGNGTYSLASSPGTIGAGTNLYALNAIPGGLVALTPNEQQTGCSAGFVITSISGAITNASPNATYWIGLAMSSVTNGQSSTFNNSQWTVLTY